MKHLYVSDLDGTLLGPDSLVSEESSRIINRLSQLGVAVTVATARTPATVEELLAGTRTIVPAIVMTGAALWDRDRECYLNPVFPDAALLPDVMAAFASAGINPFVYVLDGSSKLNVYHTSDLTSHEDKFYEERRGLKRKRFVFGDTPALRGIAGTILIFAVAEADRIEAVAARLRAVEGLSVSAYRDIFNHEIGFIEVFGAGVSKANAIRWLAGRIGADRVTVYGDNLNDLPMFDVADESVAVANAFPEVIRRAGRVIGRNSESAVARDIWRLECGDETVPSDE